MNCYDSIKKLCAKEGISPTTLCKKLNLSTSMATRWKSGTIPRGSTLEKIADYFGVTADDLLGVRTMPEAVDLQPPLTHDELNLIARYRNDPTFAAIVDAVLTALVPRSGRK